MRLAVASGRAQGRRGKLRTAAVLLVIVGLFFFGIMLKYHFLQ